MPLSPWDADPLERREFAVIWTSASYTPAVQHQKGVDFFCEANAYAPLEIAAIHQLGLGERWAESPAHQVIRIA